MKNYFSSTVGRKQLVALGGLALAIFVFTHMAGNMLILVSPKAYNLYAHKLISNPFIYFAEAGLVALFLIHVFFAMAVTFRNWGARKQKYAVRPKEKASSSLSARTMWFQGTIILIFLIIHILTFKYGKVYMVTYDGHEIRDLHRLVVEVFQEPVYVIGYLISLVLLFGHLKHGVAALFTSFGYYDKEKTPTIKTIGWIYSFVVVAGFISQPLYVYFFYNG